MVSGKGIRIYKDLVKSAAQGEKGANRLCVSHGVLQRPQL